MGSCLGQPLEEQSHSTDGMVAPVVQSPMDRVRGSSSDVNAENNIQQSHSTDTMFAPVVQSLMDLGSSLDVNAENNKDQLSPRGVFTASVADFQAKDPWADKVEVSSSELHRRQNAVVPAIAPSEDLHSVDSSDFV